MKKYLLATLVLCFIAQTQSQTATFNSRQEFKSYLLSTSTNLNSILTKEHLSPSDYLNLYQTLLVLEKNVKENFHYFSFKTGICNTNYSSFIIRAGYSVVDYLEKKSLFRGDMIALNRIMGWMAQDCL